MLESKFQGDLIKRLRADYPGCIIMKNDASYIQGIPDLLVLFDDKWAALEVKRAKDSISQANQQWYIEKMNDMSFAAFVHPGNIEEVLDALQSTFRPRRLARAAQR
jgi:hypothetical protein